MLNIVISSLVIMAASLIGVVSIWKQFGKFIENNLHYLVSFSSGVFIVIAYGLTTETIEHIGVFSTSFLWIITGAVLSLAIFKLLPHFHHHEDPKESHKHSHIDARRILFSDAIHNAADGILLASSFAVSTAVGIATTISIFIHEIVQEISEFFVLRDAGLSVKKALIMNFSVSSTILFGSIGGYFLLDRFEMAEAPLLGITAGAFLVIIAHDLIPHSIQSIHTEKHVWKHIGWFILGLVIMLTLSLLLGHSN